MKQSEMLATLKELRSDLLRYAAGSDSIVPGAYAEALDEAIKTLDRMMWRKVEDESPKEKGLYLVAYHPAYWDRIDFNKTEVNVDSFRGGNADNRSRWAHNKYRAMTHWMPLPDPPKGENNG